MAKYKVFVHQLVINEMTIDGESEKDAKEKAKNIIKFRAIENELNPAPSIDSIGRVIIETNAEEIKIKCVVCNDTGIMQYHDIDGMTIYSWQPYKTKPCTYCK
jgi:rRNA-processing protein FCF1